MGESTNYDVSEIENEKRHQIHAGLILHESTWVSLNGELTAIYKRHFGSDAEQTLPIITSDDLYEGQNNFAEWDSARRMALVQDLLDVLIRKEIPLIVASLNNGTLENAKNNLNNPEALTKPIDEIIIERFLLALNMYMDELQMSTMDPSQIMESSWTIDDYSMLVCKYGGSVKPEFMANFLNNSLNIPNPSVLEDISYVSRNNSPIGQLVDLCAYFVMRWLTEPEGDYSYIDYINGLQDGRVLQVIYPVQL
tara:strand:+ start:35983 stop:36738 length:756 start_codon:yes stop_codon:yes gene_type:complete